MSSGKQHSYTRGGVSGSTSSAGSGVSSKRVPVAKMNTADLARRINTLKDRLRPYLSVSPSDYENGGYEVPAKRARKRTSLWPFAAVAGGGAIAATTSWATLGAGLNAFFAPTASGIGSAFAASPALGFLALVPYVAIVIAVIALIAMLFVSISDNKDNRKDAERQEQERLEVEGPRKTVGREHDESVAKDNLKKLDRVSVSGSSSPDDLMWALQDLHGLAGGVKGNENNAFALSKLRVEMNDLLCDTRRGVERDEIERVNGYGSLAAVGGWRDSVGGVQVAGDVCYANGGHSMRSGSYRSSSGSHVYGGSTESSLQHVGVSPR